ncbi:MAG TPA: hypothetical protein VM943_08790 [Pyrinomonadaceae bacterium]|nr:hypothetical protein [Pyrinomonadaceae bacterium]
MKLIIKLMLQGVAVFVFAAASTPPTPAQQGGTALPDRRERERQRDAMRRYEDVQRRQFALRMLDKQVGRPNEPLEPQLALAQIREDFLHMQMVNRDMAQMVLTGVPLDPKIIAKSAAEIKKRAGRLKFNLMLPEPEKGAKLPKSEVFVEPEHLKSSLAALSELITCFVNNPMFQNANTIEADLAAKARRDLEEIIELSGHVKKSSEKFDKVARKAGARQ